jgi:hypothetical protein
MESVLAELNISDPTADAAEEEIQAGGVTSQAAEQKMRHEEVKKEKKEKKEKKDKKKKDKKVHEEDAADDVDAMDIDGGVPLRVKEKKHKDKDKKDKKDKKAKKEKKLSAMMS